MLSDLCQLFHGIKLLTNVRPIKFHFHKTPRRVSPHCCLMKFECNVNRSFGNGKFPTKWVHHIPWLIAACKWIERGPELHDNKNSFEKGANKQRLWYCNWTFPKTLWRYHGCRYIRMFCINVYRILTSHKPIPPKIDNHMHGRYFALMMTRLGLPHNLQAAQHTVIA